jgi:hypothetical protein
MHATPESGHQYAVQPRVRRHTRAAASSAGCWPRPPHAEPPHANCAAFNSPTPRRPHAAASSPISSDWLPLASAATAAADSIFSSYARARSSLVAARRMLPPSVRWSMTPPASHSRCVPPLRKGKRAGRVYLASLFLGWAPPKQKRLERGEAMLAIAAGQKT